MGLHGLFYSDSFTFFTLYVEMKYMNGRTDITIPVCVSFLHDGKEHITNHMIGGTSLKRNGRGL
jgi:hypothetical protein